LGEKSYDYLPRDLQPDDTSVFFGIATSRAYTYFQESLVDGVIDKSTLRPENYHDQCDFHIRTALDAGMNAKHMSEKWRVPIETIQQLIDKVLTVN
jgi:hypothetical protein